MSDEVRKKKSLSSNFFYIFCPKSLLKDFWGDWFIGQRPMKIKD